MALFTGSLPVLACVVLLAAPLPAFGKGFLSDPGHLQSGLDARSLQLELSEAMGLALGCGGHVGTEELVGIERELVPIWRSLPKISEGRVERRLLRYLVHRFFDRRSALHIRGFEPSRPMNGSGWGDADILSQRVPAYVESVLESRHKLEAGFDLRDAALMVATIQQLVFDSESAALEKVYATQGKSSKVSLDHAALRQVLESFMVRWMVGDDDATVSLLLSNRSLLEEAIPHWGKIASMAEGHVRATEHRRQHDPRGALADASSRPGHNALSAQYSFEDAHRVVGSITKSFASFWESECQSMKTSLVEMDTHNTGRVPLSKFYSSALDSEWRFGESEAYLRELGALDETSWRGKQVIIPNYIQGASNCIVSTSHYLLCCVNECEALMGELEVAVGAPEAEPSKLLEVVGTMSSQTSLDDDFPAPLQGSLVAQLERIGDTHGGLVPLHGRLFAQWLHYAFPRECPFPHKAGTAASLTPLEFGDQYLAEGTDMKLHARSANSSDLPSEMGREQLQWMSQWSHEEELISEQAVRSLRAPWERRGFVAGGAALFIAVGLLGTIRARAKIGGCDACPANAYEKAHFV